MWKIAQFGLTYGQDFGSWAAKLYKEFQGRVFIRSWSPINYSEFSGKCLADYGSFSFRCGASFKIFSCNACICYTFLPLLKLIPNENPAKEYTALPLNCEH